MSRLCMRQIACSAAAAAPAVEETYQYQAEVGNLLTTTLLRGLLCSNSILTFSAVTHDKSSSAHTQSRTVPL